MEDYFDYFLEITVIGVLGKWYGQLRDELDLL